MEPGLLRDFLCSLASRQGWKYEEELPHFRLTLDPDTMDLLGLDSPTVELDLSSEASMAQSTGFPAVLELVARQTVRAPGFSHLHYLKTESEEEALQAARKQVTEMPSMSCEPLAVRVLRVLVRLSYGSLRTRESLYLGIHMFNENLKLCLPFRGDFLTPGLLRSEHKPVILPESQLRDALRQLLTLLENDIREECESVAQYLIDAEAREMARARNLYDKLQRQGQRGFGRSEGAEFTPQEFEDERKRVLRNIEDRYELSIEVSPVSLCLVECSARIFQSPGWKIVKLPFMGRLLTSPCSGCGISRDKMQITSGGLRCHLCN